MSKHISKKLLQEFRAAANELPVLHYQTKIGQVLKGSELMLTGIKLENDAAIDPEKLYTIKTPQLWEINHYRRMKRVYSDFMHLGHARAYEEVKEYCTVVIGIDKKHQASLNAEPEKKPLGAKLVAFLRDKLQPS